MNSAPNIQGFNMKKMLSSLAVALLGLMTALPQAQADSSPMGIIPLLGIKHRDFTISLKSNPSTGYKWYLVRYDTNFIEPLRHEYKPAASKDHKKKLGAPGLEVWHFRASERAFRVPHMFTMVFIYKQPWSDQIGQQVSYSVVTK